MRIRRTILCLATIFFWAAHDPDVATGQSSELMGRPLGGNISSPLKEPTSQISQLVHTLSEALDDTLRGCRG